MENKVRLREVNDSWSYEEFLQEILKTAEKLRQFRDDCYNLSFTPSQRSVFDAVVQAVQSGEGGCFFVEGGRGRVKLDLLNAILAAVLLEDNVQGDCTALATSSLQLSSRLLLNGQTFHSIFNANLNVTMEQNLPIEKGTSHAQIVRRARVIVVDEAVFLNKLHIEQLDVKLREIADSEKVFGGKVIVLAGDFRALLPVDSNDNLQSVINRSHLWSEFEKLSLSSNGGMDPFDEWLQRLGNGDIPIVSAFDLDRGEQPNIELPEDMCMDSRAHNREKLMKGLIEFVFPSFDENIHKCAILAPTKNYVHEINAACMQRMPGTSKACISGETPAECTRRSNPLVTCPVSNERRDLPPLRLDLKIGVPLILLVKDCNEELSTGTRLVLKNICDERLECTVPGGRVVNIQKIMFRDNGIERVQFPVQVAFAATIHKSQGMMLNRVGVWLEGDVFRHGQLYAAASCVKHREDIRFVLPKRGVPPCYAALNIVNKEVFQEPAPAPPI